MLALYPVLPRQGEVARRSRDGGGGYGKAYVCGDAPSTTRLWRAVPLPRCAREDVFA
ncbi:hypothetical protein GGR47_002306 [Sphingomonas aquatilis]|uniref:Uncharacterized protein n=1 Tax=Sphingomonas aquatilis TaxID=93063 RepID=A0AAW3TSL5_9SPHN|nr:hypothetical protein [Sphingomonas aquatilis]